VLALAIVAGFAIAYDATADKTTLVVSPISASPSGKIHNGKLVSVNLITTDPQKAVKFYSTVLGWQAQYFADEKYIELNRDERSVVLFEEDEAKDGDARWLVSTSVDDVGEAAQRAVEMGGFDFQVVGVYQSDLPETR